MNQITYTTTNVLHQVRFVWFACTWHVSISITVRLPILNLTQASEPRSSRARFLHFLTQDDVNLSVRDKAIRIVDV